MRFLEQVRQLDVLWKKWDVVRLRRGLCFCLIEAKRYLAQDEQCLLSHVCRDLVDPFRTEREQLLRRCSRMRDIQGDTLVLLLLEALVGLETKKALLDRVLGLVYTHSQPASLILRQDILARFVPPQPLPELSCPAQG